MLNQPLDLHAVPLPVAGAPRGGLAGVFPTNLHLCHFYRNTNDFLELMIPFFLEGLAVGDFCLWGVAAPLTVESACAALDGPLGGALSGFLERRQIEIFDIGQLYGNTPFDAAAVKDAFFQKVDSTRDLGWSGFRCDGMVSNVSPTDWRNFQIYEHAISDALGTATTALCSYNFTALSAHEASQVLNSHQASIIRKNGAWSVIRMPRS